MRSGNHKSRAAGFVGSDGVGRWESAHDELLWPTKNFAPFPASSGDPGYNVGRRFVHPIWILEGTTDVTEENGLGRLE